MRVTKGYYGDSFIVTDELPFSGSDILRAAHKVKRDYGENVWEWPVTIDFLEKTGYWEAWFTRPATDEEYEERMRELPVES